MPRQYHVDPLQGVLPMEPPRRFELRTYALRVSSDSEKNPELDLIREGSRGT